jgi:hypothetical protein
MEESMQSDVEKPIKFAMKKTVTGKVHRDGMQISCFGD